MAEVSIEKNIKLGKLISFRPKFSFYAFDSSDISPLSYKKEYHAICLSSYSPDAYQYYFYIDSKVYRIYANKIYGLLKV